MNLIKNAQVGFFDITFWQKNGFILAEHEKRIVSHPVLELFDSVVDLAINEELKRFKLDLDLVNFSL